MFLLLDFSSSSLLYYFLALLLSVLLSGDGWMQKLSTTFQSFPAVWKQITLSSSDISTTQVVSGKRLKNHFTSISYPKDWHLEHYPKPQALAYSPVFETFSPETTFFPLPFHRLSFIWALQQNKPTASSIPVFHIHFQKESRNSDVSA